MQLNKIYLLLFSLTLFYLQLVQIAYAAPPRPHKGNQGINGEGHLDGAGINGDGSLGVNPNTEDIGHGHGPKLPKQPKH